MMPPSPWPIWPPPGDTDALPVAMKALSDTCGACHKLYKY
jgi:cytochrome c556